MIRKRNTCSRLRHKLTLQQEVDTPDSAGGSQRSWSTVTDLWAEIVPLTGSGMTSSRSLNRESLVAGQIQAEISHRILLRYQGSTLITPAMRLVYESRIFNIRSVANIEENRDTLELLVQEGAPA